MNRFSNFVVVVMGAVIMTGSQVDAEVINVTEGSTSGYTMTDGNTYVIQDSVSFSCSTAGGSGMTVADGATVVIFVPSNVTLTAIGANGSGQTGGGAGIRVPESSTLIITGEGTVKATGGNAGNGGNGEDGSKGQVSVKNDVNWFGSGSSGIGGRGGVGGGGAGAAIGGSGGSGGNGGIGGESCIVEKKMYSQFCQDGNDGSSGCAGGNGMGMGECYVLGRTCIVPSEGASGTAGNAGVFADWSGVLDCNSSTFTTHFTTCGGGGGGGGGAGCSPAKNIGGGGAAGGGGGGGGSGATAAGCSYASDRFPLTNAHGGGGEGGMSDIAAGGSGVAKEKTNGGGTYRSNHRLANCHTYYGGNGGAGGAAGAEGGAGTLYVSPTATVNVEREKLTATTHPAAQYRITFNANGGQFLSSTVSMTATLGCELPDCIPTPTMSGYVFDGWKTANGEEYYGALGTKSISSYPVADDVVLYAQWHLDENVDYTITTPEPIPYSYFDKDYPTLLAEHGGDYESAAKATAANGRNKVWECYVAGISPTNAASVFTAGIEIVGGVPQVTWSPNLNTNGIERSYTIWGKTNLTDGADWECPTNSAHRFFKVTVGMP